jgi:hypothetical protein
MGAPAPEGVGGYSGRPGRRRFQARLSTHHYVGRIGFALLFSFLLHISAVTVFKIVVYIPIEQRESFNVSLVALRGPATAAPSTGAGNGTRLQLAQDLNLPTLEIAQYERLRLSSLTLDEIEDPLLPEEDAPDSWARFSGALQEAGESISDFTLSLRTGTAPALDALTLEERPKPVLRPAEGYELYVAWEDGAERELVFAPTLQVLWGRDPGELERPIELSIRVNAAGRVVNALSRRIDQPEILDALQRAVLQFRFAPRVDVTDNSQDSATVQLRATEEDR